MSRALRIFYVLLNLIKVLGHITDALYNRFYFVLISANHFLYDKHLHNHSNKP